MWGLGTCSLWSGPFVRPHTRCQRGQWGWTGTRYWSASLELRGIVSKTRQVRSIRTHFSERWLLQWVDTPGSWVQIYTSVVFPLSVFSDISVHLPKYQWGWELMATAVSPGSASWVWHGVKCHKIPILISVNDSHLCLTAAPPILAVRR